MSEYKSIEIRAVKQDDENACAVKTEPDDVEDVYTLEETIIKEEMTIEPTIIQAQKINYCKPYGVEKVKKVLNFDVDTSNGKVVCINDLTIFPTDKDLVRLEVPVRPITLENEENAVVTSVENSQDGLTRKHKRQPEKCITNKRKKLRQSGHEYVDKKGNKHAAKTVKGRCSAKCTYTCADVSDEDREKIRHYFYSLSDAKKNMYYNQYTKRIKVQRRRTSDPQTSRRKYTYLFYFNVNGTARRVCNAFFCRTLDISHKRVHYFHQNFSSTTSLDITPKKGKSGKKGTNEEKIDEIKRHIESFPTIQSYYCRNTTKREYLDSNLSIKKMHNLYQNSHSDPVKENVYRKVFNCCYNLSFHKPKKDVCDACSEFKQITNPTPQQQMRQNEHITRKEIGATERKNDRTNTDENTAIIVFDLENVIPLPKANTSCFFYKSKLNVYNLTVHCNRNKTAYNCVWNEMISGRSGNDIASALIKILQQVVQDLPHIRKIIMWSDSCVPQNRNSHMSTALMDFMKSTDHNLDIIIQKFSEPGHGNLQEVDCVHSLIERHLRHLEIYSPISLMCSMKKLKSNSLTFKFIQMLSTDFLLHGEHAEKFTFSKIPYSKVKQILYTKNRNTVAYRCGFDQEYTSVDIIKKSKIEISNIKTKEVESEISKKKMQDIQSMYKYMPLRDILFYTSLFKKYSSETNSQTKTTNAKVPKHEQSTNSQTKTVNAKEAKSEQSTKKSAKCLRNKKKP